LAKNIPGFKRLNEMPVPLGIRRIDDGQGIETTLVNNSAKYHHSYWMLFNNTKLEKAMRRRSAKAEDGCETSKFIRKRSTVEKVGVAECSLCEMEMVCSRLAR
jgi:hypothetical protein